MQDKWQEDESTFGVRNARVGKPVELQIKYSTKVILVHFLL